MDSQNKIPAKMCYSHLGGKLGNLLLENFIEKGWLSKEEPGAKHFIVTKRGFAGFKKLGVDLSEVKTE